ncbi:MAG TPA: glycosyltransferase family 9 protein [Ignavibacteria bacterium]|nr:glycosyltransferase family 9 protein [Ignavibacteria bacterium]HMR41661.1 glycosyltransferase family 9 protein [Ignavibacteria bacterium]
MFKINKILVIRLSSLGDIILSFPLLKKLREKFPSAEIHFLTKEIYLEAVKLNPVVDKILILNENIKNSRREIRKNQYDLIIDIHKNFRSIYLSAFNGKSIKRYKKDNFRKFLLVNLKIDLLKNALPVFGKYLRTISEYLKNGDYNYTTSELVFDKRKEIEKDYIVIAPSSKHYTKRYPENKFVNFINEFHKLNNIKFVLVGDSSEKDQNICGFISEKCSNTINLCGKLSLDKLAGVLYHSTKIITNDSAVLHLSEALGKSVNAVFGSTVKQFGFFPQLNDSEVFEIKGLKCRPCTHIGRDKCPEGHFKCMEEIHLKIKN